MGVGLIACPRHVRQMSSTPKKLRNGPIIAVDDQILRWRQKMRREEIQIGKGMRSAERRAERMAKQRETNTNEKLIASFKKKFGG